VTLQQHLVATATAGAILAPGAPVEGLALFAVGSVLIDVDHLLFYFVRTGRLDVSGMFTYFRENVDRNIHSIPYLGVCVLHTVEFLLAVALSALLFPLLGYLLAGLIFHLCLDIWDLVRLKVPFIRAYSLVEHLVRRRTPGYPFA
jgi:hypothetical protein